jgi:hypothetical protein
MQFLGFKLYLLALNIYLHSHNQQKHMFFFVLYSIFKYNICIYIKIGKIK